MAFKVLIVDDSLPMRSVMKKTVKASGFNVASFFEAANGIEALHALKKEWLDLVLTDYKMPDMDGLELIQEMKKDDILKAIPVVMITTEGSRRRVEELMEKGAAGYIKKPFMPEQIRQTLNTIMGEAQDGEGSLDNGDEDLGF